MASNSVDVDEELRAIRVRLDQWDEQLKLDQQGLSEEERERLAHKTAELDDVMLVWTVLVSVKGAESPDATRAFRELATMSVARMLERFVPEEIRDEAFAIYEGDQEATRRHGLA